MVALAGLVLLFCGIAMIEYGLETANLDPATGNDNIAYCMLELLSVFLAFVSFVWTVATFKLAKPNEADTDLGATPASSPASGGSFGSNTVVECQNCGKSISTSLAQIEMGINCPFCDAAITVDTINWGNDNMLDDEAEGGR